MMEEGLTLEQLQELGLDEDSIAGYQLLKQQKI
jgi:hypothetical protein